MNSKKLVFTITLMCCIILLAGCEMNWTEREEVNDIPAKAKLQYVIMSYEKATDEF